jgi:hypothetical protein
MHKTTDCVPSQLSLTAFDGLLIAIERMLSLESIPARQMDLEINLLNCEPLTIAPLKNQFRMSDRPKTK